MELGIRRSFDIFAPGRSLRRRIGYSLAIVRVVLVPVIFLAIYYLFRMGTIVDRIVAVDAPTAILAQQVSVQMVEVKRAERNYFLFHDPTYLQANRDALSNVQRLLGELRDLQPDESSSAEEALRNAALYETQFTASVSGDDKYEGTPVLRLQQVVTAYERDLNEILKRAKQKRRERLIEELRIRIESFDTEIAQVVGSSDPGHRRGALDLHRASQTILHIASELEKRGWTRVQRDHLEARGLLRRAEWVLSIVSGLTFLLSVWISFVLPRQVVRPLVNLKQAVDHAASGNYQIEFQVQGEGEVVALARSIENLIHHVRQAVSLNPSPSPDSRR
jgi:CHASE3 domain sensor protein